MSTRSQKGDLHRLRILQPALDAAAAAALPTPLAAGQAGTRAAMTTTAVMTTDTAGTGGILPPTRTPLEVATEADADAAATAAAAICPSRPPCVSHIYEINFRIFFSDALY